MKLHCFVSFLVVFFACLLLGVVVVVWIFFFFCHLFTPISLCGHMALKMSDKSQYTFNCTVTLIHSSPPQIHLGLATTNTFALPSENKSLFFFWREIKKCYGKISTWKWYFQ